MTVNVGGKTCPCSIWPATAAPANPNEPDASAVELGVKFRTDVAGSITGIRFYKSSQNTGTHVGRPVERHRHAAALGDVRRRDGERLAAGDVREPRRRSPPTRPTSRPTGRPTAHYADDVGAFSGVGVDSPPLHALRSGVDGPNGVWGDLGTFPTSEFADSNYWVDVSFS